MSRSVNYCNPKNGYHYSHPYRIFHDDATWAKRYLNRRNRRKERHMIHMGLWSYIPQRYNSGEWNCMWW